MHAGHRAREEADPAPRAVAAAALRAWRAFGLYAILHTLFASLIR